MPDTAGPWKPIRLPKEWQELGVTWVRTRVVIPAAWKGLGLRLNLGPVDDRDTTFFNGRRIGSTDGWDKPRNYLIPQDAVAWDRENEIAVAVDNVFAGGGLYRGPLELAAGEPAPTRPWFAAPAQEDEVRRAPPGPGRAAAAASPDGRFITACCVTKTAGRLPCGESITIRKAGSSTSR